MRQISQLQRAVENLPPWAQYSIGAALIAFAAVSIYGRINTKFGVKVFSRIPESEIRSNYVHIVRYTLIPAVVCLGYVALLLTR